MLLNACACIRMHTYVCIRIIEELASAAISTTYCVFPSVCFLFVFQLLIDLFVMRPVFAPDSLQASLSLQLKAVNLLWLSERGGGQSFHVFLSPCVSLQTDQVRLDRSAPDSCTGNLKRVKLTKQGSMMSQFWCLVSGGGGHL